jgi:hypothetical protein
MLRAFRDLPKDASNELRDANREISEDMARAIRTAAQAKGSQSGLVVPTIKAMRDRVPSVQAGGTRRAGKQTRRSIGQKPTTVADIMFGANFGASRLRQFPPVRKPDHWFFTTVEKHAPDIERRWLAAADNVLSQWGSGS